VTIFEDFNENYLKIFQSFPARNWMLNPDRKRLTAPWVGTAFATKRRQLEHLSVAFITDARDFFDACQPQWRWHQLRSLALTSQTMYKANSLQISMLLEAAAQSALEMPKLETMALWNGAKGEACAFTWCRQGTLVSWRGTWDLQLEDLALEAWKAVACKYAPRRELTVRRVLLAHEINSHGDTVHY
jgi:hypothetical protein